MDAQEEFDRTQMIIKGKRTKRRRPSSPSHVPITSTSSSSCGGGGVGVEGGGGGDYNSVLSSPAVSSEAYESSTEEEEDMANCLILLAQGNHSPKMERFSGRRFSDGGADGIYLYQCKTCDRNFPSFQALGGHRASHKKPKPAPRVEEKKPKFQHDSEEGNFLLTNRSTSLVSLQIPNNKISKIHECSICGAEFSSGQALGGHMRRHRAATQPACAVVDSNDQAEKTRNVLHLDLNLPAPEDHDHDHGHQFESNFVHQFVSTQPPPLVFSSPTLVDCHY